MGLATDKPVPGDYDGDGKFDLGVFRANEGTWYINQSMTGSMLGLQWGTVGDKPMAAFQLPE